MITSYFIGHKPFEMPPFQQAVSLQVGPQPDFGMKRDNTGDNIAAKNPTFCELTALYWIWKNEPSRNPIAINHYRRWFPILSQPDKVIRLLETYDVLVPRFEPYKETVYEQYCIDSGFARDLDALKRILHSQHPEDVWAFDAVMEQGGLFQYNMMITSRSLFDAYCAWIFPLLFELEKQTDLSEYNDYQKRIYGFLSERMFNVWLKARNLKVKELPVLQPQMSREERFRLPLRRLKNRIWFATHYKPAKSARSA